MGFQHFFYSPVKLRGKYPRLGARSASHLVLWVSWLLGLWLLCQEKTVKQKVMIWLNIGRNDHHLPSFSSFIIFWVYVRTSLQSQGERTDITGDSGNHFRRNIFVFWSQNVRDNMTRKVLPQFLSALLAWPLAPPVFLPFSSCGYKWASPFFPLFSLYLGPDPSCYCPAYTPLPKKYWNMFY